MEEDYFEKGDRGRSLRVYLINPPYENPTRTIGDYKKEQEEARETHRILLEQHAAFLRQQAEFQKAQRWNALMSLATIVIAIGTLWIAALTARSLNASEAKQGTQKQQMQDTQQPGTDTTPPPPDK